MSEDKQLYIKELASGIYLMDEGHAASGYLVVGQKKACLIDTMNGWNNLAKAIAGITDKPVTVINTHGHPDHIFGNVFFNEAYMNTADLSVAAQFINDPNCYTDLPEEGLTFPPFKNIKEGDVIDLGSRTLKAYGLPGHTPGGILLLLPEERILFVGDAINHHLWMQVPGALPMAEFVTNLERLMFLEKEADRLLHGHARDFDDISLMHCVLQGAKEILAGQDEGDEPYQYFGGEARMHHFTLEPGKHYSQPDGSVIVYNP